MSIDTDEVFARCELLIYSKIVPYLAENAPEVGDEAARSISKLLAFIMMGRHNMKLRGVESAEVEERARGIWDKAIRGDSSYLEELRLFLADAEGVVLS